MEQTQNLIQITFVQSLSLQVSWEGLGERLVAPLEVVLYA